MFAWRLQGHPQIRSTLLFVAGPPPHDYRDTFSFNFVYHVPPQAGNPGSDRSRRSRSGKVLRASPKGPETRLQNPPWRAQPDPATATPPTRGRPINAPFQLSGLPRDAYPLWHLSLHCRSSLTGRWPGTRPSGGGATCNNRNEVGPSHVLPSVRPLPRRLLGEQTTRTRLLLRSMQDRRSPSPKQEFPGRSWTALSLHGHVIDDERSPAPSSPTLAANGTASASFSPSSPRWYLTRLPNLERLEIHGRSQDSVYQLPPGLFQSNPRLKEIRIRAEGAAIEAPPEIFSHLDQIQWLYLEHLYSEENRPEFRISAPIPPHGGHQQRGATAVELLRTLDGRNRRRGVTGHSPQGPATRTAHGGQDPPGHRRGHRRSPAEGHHMAQLPRRNASGCGESTHRRPPNGEEESPPGTSNA